MHQESQGQYTVASKKATIAFVLMILTIVLTLLSWVVIVGVLVGLRREGAPCRGLAYEPMRGYCECYSQREISCCSHCHGIMLFLADCAGGAYNFNY